MSKYDALTLYLKGCPGSQIPMTFAEIEQVIGKSLPASRKYNAWWSNNPTNNVMTKAWLAAGYRTEQVDPVRERVVFVRDSRIENKAVSPPQEKKNGRHPGWGALQGTTKWASNLDLTEPPDADWGKVYDN